MKEKFNKQKKFELIRDEFGMYYRVRALRDFSDVKKGDIGGSVQKEENLSHDGDCWIYDGACALASARVSGNARVEKTAVICGKVKVTGSAIVSGAITIGGDTEIGNTAKVEELVTIDMDELLCPSPNTPLLR